MRGLKATVRLGSKRPVRDRSAHDRGRRQASPLIAGLLLVSLLCYGLALQQRSLSGQPHRSVAKQAPTHPATRHVVAAAANPDLPVLAQRTGHDAVPYHRATAPIAAITAVLSDGPPSVHRGPNPVPPRPTLQPATGMVPGTGRATPRPSATAQRGLLTISAVAAGLRTFNQNLVLRDVQPAAAVGDVPARPTPIPTPVHRLAVWVTGYTLTGTTAMGTQAGPGICAVDPAVIPLGTRITISGIGACVAEDTGPEVLGAHIDVWVPTVSEAYALTGWHSAAW